MNIFNSFTNIFIKPGLVFKSGKENKLSWLLPLILIMLLYFIGSYYLVVDLVIPDHLDKLSSAPYLSEAEKEAARDYFQSSFHIFSTFLSTAFSKLIYYPVLSFLLTLLPLLCGGKPVKYFKIFTAVIYTGVINSIGFLLDTFLKLKYQTLDIGLNLALLVDSSNIFVNSLLAKINIFDFWQIFLLVLLISIYYDYSRRKSSFIIIASWVIIKLATAYFAYLKVLI